VPSATCISGRPAHRRWSSQSGVLRPIPLNWSPMAWCSLLSAWARHLLGWTCTTWKIWATAPPTRPAHPFTEPGLRTLRLTATCARAWPSPSNPLVQVPAILDDPRARPCRDRLRRDGWPPSPRPWHSHRGRCAGTSDGHECSPPHSQGGDSIEEEMASESASRPRRLHQKDDTTTTRPRGGMAREAWPGSAAPLMDCPSAGLVP